MLRSLAFWCALSVASSADVGTKPADFGWKELPGGARHSSSELAGQISVLVFVSAKCPISIAYGPRLNDLYTKYSAKGVRFLFLAPNVNETEPELLSYSKQAQLKFPLARDEKNITADAIGTELTPEVAVLDREGVIRYRGAIDDAQNPARVKVRGLESAVEDLLAGRAVARPELKAFGCTVKRVGGR
jgi:hypothetical protein